MRSGCSRAAMAISVEIDEMLPGVLPPLLWEVNSHLVDEAFMSLLDRLGLPLDGIDGVDDYRVMDPMFEAVRIAMAARGEPYSAEYIQGISGAAPNCRILPLRVNLTSGMNQNRADAINYAAGRASEFDGMVLSNSWIMSSGSYTAVYDAIQAAMGWPDLHFHLFSTEVAAWPLLLVWL